MVDLGSWSAVDPGSVQGSETLIQAYSLITPNTVSVCPRRVNWYVESAKTFVHVYESVVL